MTIDRLAADPRVAVRIKGAPDADGEAVVYWMQRAQRPTDNPALDVAIALGNLLHKPVVTFFGLNPFVEHANLRHYHFLVQGLPDIAEGLRARQVGFVLRTYPHHRLLPFLEEVRPAALIGDESPLRQQQRWREAIADDAKVPYWSVDADVVVPTHLIETEQYAARTIRPRLHKHLPAFLVATDEPVAHVPFDGSRVPGLPVVEGILDDLPLDRSVTPVDTLRGGTRAGREQLQRFVRTGLADYSTRRNAPEVEGTSRLSPYLHFGHLGPREVAHTIRSSGAPKGAIDAFLEQLIVRRELATNFVFYNTAYDRLDGCEAWARQTLRQHGFDPRAHVYTFEQLEAADTHDPLWNAAQLQMTITGWMHGYIRMYWAKKILEWSATPDKAFDIAVRLNDRYELDGRDPNGYTNIAWAICGKHDRPWPPRPIYGTVRSMSLANTAKKFDAAAYIARYGRGDATPLWRESR